MNIWIGKAKDGSSSGLHHDYHDNLYILLNGRKQFRLFSPNDAKKLYVRGKIHKIHSNGLISYDELPTRSDGANMIEVTSEETSLAEKELEIAEKEFEKLESNPDATSESKEKALQRVQDAEERLNNAMEASLDACENENDFGDDDIDSDDSFIEKYPNFSNLSINDLNKNKNTLKNFPLFKNATQTICELKAGQMLYLPASWFHEVVSFNEIDNYHCAMNYWVYPPNIDGTFEQPYEDNFWQRRWEKRTQEKQTETDKDSCGSPPKKKQKIN